MLRLSTWLVLFSQHTLGAELEGVGKTNEEYKHKVNHYLQPHLLVH